MNNNETTTESAYEVVVDCHVAGRSFSRGDRVDANQLAELRRVLLEAGLLREIETSAV